jgi:hypothetical protein
MSKNWTISVDELASDLENVKAQFDDVPADEEGEDEEEGNYIDVRLQVRKGGSWSLHTGDASYDQDHRGFWGSGCVGKDTDCKELAEELIGEAEEDFATSGETDDEGEERPVW